jgi:hypothetical protein
MSPDGSYDMVLLPPQHDNNDGRRLARRRRTRRRHLPMAEEEHPGLPCHPPRRRRRIRNDHGQAGGSTSSAVGPEQVDDVDTPAGDMSGVILAPGTTTGVTSQQCANPRRTDDAGTLARDLSGISLAPEITTHSISDATSPPSTNQEVPSVFHPVPFRFSFDPPSDPTSASTFARAYPDLPGYHMWSTWDLLTAVSTSGPAGSKEGDDPNFSWDFSGLRDPSAMRDFISACDHCLSGCSDDGHSLDDEGYDPTRECFHIDQGDHNEDNHLDMPGNDDALVSASRVEIPRELAVAQVPVGGQGTQLEQLREMQAKLDEERGDLCSSDKTSSKSGQAEHSPEERVIGPGTSSAVSLTMPGKAAPGLQRGRPEPSCSDDVTSNNAGAIHHRGATYPGRTQGPPGKCRSPTSRELSAVSAVSATLPRPKDSAPRLLGGRFGASATTRRPRAPQTYSSLGRAVHHRQNFEARDIQVGQRSRQGLQQRLEHRTATSLLPLKCFKSFMYLGPFTCTNKKSNCQGRIGLASAKTDPPSGARRGEPPLRQNFPRKSFLPKRLSCLSTILITES